MPVRHRRHLRAFRCETYSMQWRPNEPGVMVFPSGRTVRGRRWSEQVGTEPELGLYALWRDPKPSWPYAWLRWPDFGLPLSRDNAWAAIERVWLAAGSERVEVACGGGRGRTGTVLAGMVMLDGLDADAAIAWVRRGYDAQAVEAPWQRQWLLKH